MGFLHFSRDADFHIVNAEELKPSKRLGERLCSGGCDSENSGGVAESASTVNGHLDELHCFLSLLLV